MHKPTLSQNKPTPAGRLQEGFERGFGRDVQALGWLESAGGPVVPLAVARVRGVLQSWRHLPGIGLAGTRWQHTAEGLSRWLCSSQSARNPSWLPSRGQEMTGIDQGNSDDEEWGSNTRAQCHGPDRQPRMTSPSVTYLLVCLSSRISLMHLRSDWVIPLSQLLSQPRHEKNQKNFKSGDWLTNSGPIHGSRPEPVGTKQVPTRVWPLWVEHGHAQPVVGIVPPGWIKVVVQEGHGRSQRSRLLRGGVAGNRQAFDRPDQIEVLGRMLGKAATDASYHILITAALAASALGIAGQ